MSHVLRSTLTVALFACFVGCDSGTTRELLADQPKKVEDALVEAARQMQSIQAKEQFKKLLVAPKPGQSAETLTIGEFEEQAEFERRKQLAKSRDENEHARALAEWQSKVAAIDTEIVEMRRTLAANWPGTPAAAVTTDLLTISCQEVGMPRVGRMFNAANLSLPTFNREAMSFKSVVAPDLTTEVLDSTLHSGRSVQLMVGNRSPQFEVRLPTLTAAKKFKEDYEAGKIMGLAIYGVQLSDVESPILVEPEKTREIRTEPSSEKKAGFFVLGLIAAAAGNQNAVNSAAYGMNAPNIEIEKIPARYRDGTCYKMGTKLENVVFLRVTGPTVEREMDATVKLLD